MNSEEIWKPVKGYEGLYEVSSHGEIRSVDRLVCDTIGRRYLIKGHLMQLQIGPSGYYQIGLSKDNKSKSHKVHRIVAEAFVPNPDNKGCVDHINTVRTDCRACNLRWVTLLENSNNPITKHHAKQGRHKAPIKRNISRNVISPKASNHPRRLYRYTLTGEFVDEFPSMLEADLSTGIEMSGIRKALNKSYRTAGGYLWRTDKVLFCEPYKHKKHSKSRAIIMTDSTGAKKGEWAAIRDASIELGITHTRIYNHIHAKTPIDGMWFRYK